MAPRSRKAANQLALEQRNPPAKPHCGSLSPSLTVLRERLEPMVIRAGRESKAAVKKKLRHDRDACACVVSSLHAQEILWSRFDYSDR